MPDFAVLPFALFCLIATGTPGPNNMINLAQGVRLGFWRAFPFALGTGLGIASLLIAVSLGLGVAFREVPVLQVVMKGVTLLFLLYLAWMIATSGPLKTEGDARRIGFFGGVAFQWINPKTWAAAMTMATTYLPTDPSLATVLSAGAIFCVIGWTTQPVWIGFGTALRGFLSDPARARAFNLVMAALLLAATLPVLLG
ncbi:LysE family translocator [Algihabitans albus]|uniref:LysE family translocator n=1 Tax=Algihabitans albus TaxID=2164067 RepID=UPI000E5D5216|nr:LysE family translocator [Algihabitans albus]